MSTRLNRLRRRAFAQVKRLRQRVASPTGSADPRVLLVAGVQRSGTNMVMDLLGKSWETEVYRETDARAFDDYEMRPTRVIAELVARSPAPRVVVKALLEGGRLAGLLEELAPARAIWMYRRFEDMVNSNLVNWPGGRNQIDEIVRDPAAGGWRAREMSESTHAVVRDHYREDLDDASAIALFWYYRNQLLFDQGLDADARVMLVQYESLVTDPGRHAAAIARFLGIRYTHSIASHISPSSVRRRAPPRIDARIDALCREMQERLDRAWERQESVAA